MCGNNTCHWSRTRISTEAWLLSQYLPRVVLGIQNSSLAPKAVLVHRPERKSSQRFCGICQVFADLQRMSAWRSREREGNAETAPFTSNNRLRLMGGCCCTRSKRTLSVSMVFEHAFLAYYRSYRDVHETPVIMHAGAGPGFCATSCSYLLLCGHQSKQTWQQL